MNERTGRVDIGKLRRRRWFVFLVFLAFLLVAGSHRVVMEYRILHLGYAKADAAKLNRELRERGERLEVEIAAGKDVERAAQIARRHHGMRFPLPSERVIVTMEGK